MERTVLTPHITMREFNIPMTNVGKPMSKDIVNIFEELESYKKFCVQFGWVYDEKDLCNNKSRSWTSYASFKEGKRVPNNWVKDQKKRRTRH